MILHQLNIKVVVIQKFMLIWKFYVCASSCHFWFWHVGINFDSYLGNKNFILSAAISLHNKTMSAAEYLWILQNSRISSLLLSCNQSAKVWLKLKTCAWQYTSRRDSNCKLHSHYAKIFCIGKISRRHKAYIIICKNSVSVSGVIALCSVKHVQYFWIH